MEVWEATVSIYDKPSGRSKRKEPRGEVRLLKGHPFTKGDKVKVILSSQFDQHDEEYQQKVKKLEDEVENLKNTNNQLNVEVKDILKKLTVSTNIIGKQKDIINHQETIIAIYMNRGILSRLRNPIPDELKKLEDTKKKLVELEDSGLLVIELPKNE